jgi:hypothetical protein
VMRSALSQSRQAIDQAHCHMRRKVLRQARSGFMDDTRPR